MAFVKVVLMLTGTFALSYALLKIVAPTDSEIKKKLNYRPDLNNEDTFMQSLRKSTLKKRSMNKEQTAESSDTS